MHFLCFLSHNSQMLFLCFSSHNSQMLFLCFSSHNSQMLFLCFSDAFALKNFKKICTIQISDNLVVVSGYDAVDLKRKIQPKQNKEINCKACTFGPPCWTSVHDKYWTIKINTIPFQNNEDETHMSNVWTQAEPSFGSFQNSSSPCTTCLVYPALCAFLCHALPSCVTGFVFHRALWLLFFSPAFTGHPIY